MLVLTRKPGQRIKVGENIWITILEIHGGKIRIGFDAPPEVPIQREENVQKESA